MATHRIPILGVATNPDTSGEVYQEQVDQHLTNDLYDFLVWVFADGSTRTGLYGSFHVPQNYVGTANLVVVWTTAATSGDVEWDFDYAAEGGNDVESMDPSANDESVNSNDTAPSATLERMEISISLTDGNFAAGDNVQFGFFRDKSDAGDTIADEALLIGLYFEYADA